MKYLVKATCDEGHETPMTMPGEQFDEAYVESFCEILASTIENAGGCMWKEPGTEDLCGANAVVEFETIDDEESG